MTLEVGDRVICKNAGIKGECAAVKVVGISRDNRNMADTYIMATRLGTYFQIKSHTACICNNINSCSSKNDL